MAKSRSTIATAKSASVSSLEATLADIPDFNPAEGMTTMEVAKQLGRGRNFALKWIETKIEAGQWEYAGVGERMDRTGRRQRVPVYRKKEQRK